VKPHVHGVASPPQHKRKSTGGLSFWMFMLAVMGNVTYATSVLLNTHSWQFLLQKLPWLVGRCVRSPLIHLFWTFA
jgi:hypothetical protein